MFLFSLFPPPLTSWLFFGLLFNIHSTQGRCRSWASAVSLDVLFHGPLKTYKFHKQCGLSDPLGPRHPRPAQWRNWPQEGPWPQALCHICTHHTHGCLSPALASCPPHGQSLSPSILAPAQIRGRLLVSRELAASSSCSGRTFPWGQPTIHSHQTSGPSADGGRKGWTQVLLTHFIPEPHPSRSRPPGGHRWFPWQWLYWDKMDGGREGLTHCPLRSAWWQQLSRAGSSPTTWEKGHHQGLFGPISQNHDVLPGRLINCWVRYDISQKLSVRELLTLLAHRGGWGQQGWCRAVCCNIKLKRAGEEGPGAEDVPRGCIFTRQAAGLVATPHHHHRSRDSSAPHRWRPCT